MSWVFGFPFIIVFCHFINKWLLYIFKLVNYVIVGIVPSVSALMVGFVIYTIVFVIVSIYFFARCTSR